jgi:hypothetical protein
VVKDGITVPQWVSRGGDGTKAQYPAAVFVLHNRTARLIHPSAGSISPGVSDDHDVVLTVRAEAGLQHAPADLHRDYAVDSFEVGHVELHKLSARAAQFRYRGLDVVYFERDLIGLVRPRKLAGIKPFSRA